MTTSYTLFFILSVSLHISLSSSSDPNSSTCFPAKCGALTMNYPFYIPNLQKSWCGNPGFEVSCPNGSFPYLNISGVNYLIKKIWYENQTSQIVNPNFDSSIHPIEDCPGSIQNLTLGSGLFEFESDKKDLILLFDCPESVVKEYEGDLVNCGALAVEENDPKMVGLKEKCKGRVVSVPYGGGKRGKNEGFREVLSRGVSLRWVANNCNDCVASGGQCGFNRTHSLFQCYCSDRPHSRQCSRRSNPHIIGSVAAASGSGIILVMLLVLAIYLRRRRSVNTFTFLWTRGTIQNHNVETFLKNYKSLTPKRYTYTDIKKMTNSFKDRLGEGGYGHVYKGKLMSGRLVAVKVLKKLKDNGEEFINEVLSISRTNHVNVVTLLGFCFERKKQALVYEFMPNGSLEKFIHNASSEQSLPCETLFDIAVGIAGGLDYLHRGCNTRILHFDIKPHNILLDENFCPKISDFGLARMFPKEHSHISTMEARGTIGYIAPEVFCRNFGSVSHKSDVYSFGMMVIEMICGRTNISAENGHSSDLYFPQWIYNQLQAEEQSELHGILNDDESKLQRKMILVSLWCIQAYPSNRPSMDKVIEMLQGSLESLQMPPKSVLSSTPISAIDTSSTIQLTTGPSDEFSLLGIEVHSSTQQCNY